MAARTGRKTSIPDTPVLTFRQKRLFEAFAELSTDRQIGMQEGPIPWSSIRRYADEYGFDLADLSDVLVGVDGSYMQYQEQKRKLSGAT